MGNFGPGTSMQAKVGEKRCEPASASSLLYLFTLYRLLDELSYSRAHKLTRAPPSAANERAVHM